MATLEDLGRMAMVEIDHDCTFEKSSQEGWGKMAMLLAASAAVCGLVMGLRPSSAERTENSAIHRN